MLDDLGRPPARRLARYLGVGVSTVYRYQQTGRAPRSCFLALFWVTQWGQSLVNANAINDCRLAVGYVESLQRELADVRLQLARVLELGGPHA